MTINHLRIVAACLVLCIALSTSRALAAPSTSPSTTIAPLGSPEWKPVPDDGVISAPGAYFFDKDISTDRKIGINIKADGVTLDLRGHALRFTGEPKLGVDGIVCSNHADIRITNGKVGGFWFDVHLNSTSRARISDLKIDDIPYIGVRVGGSKDVAITDNVFSNFRYDIVKDSKSTYVIGVNIASEDVIVANNKFDARPPAGNGQALAMETVFVLFRPGNNCVVTHNDMSASELLNRSYGVWVAGKASAAILHNHIRNMQFGITVAPDGNANVSHNDFVVDQPSEGFKIETTGIAVPVPKEFTEVGNTFSGMRNEKTIGGATTKPVE